MTNSNDTQKLITRGEAAEILGVTIRTVSRYMDSGRLQKYKGGALGRSVRLCRQDVERMKEGDLNQPFLRVPARTEDL